MKTAMQEFFEFLEKVPKLKDGSLSVLVEMKDVFLEKEKQQIIEAYADAMYEDGDEEEHQDLYSRQGEKYFNQTYKTKENDFNR